MKVAVTGASGFVGGALTAALRAAGHEPWPISLRGKGLPPLEEIDAIVHLAAIAHRRAASAGELRRVNVELAAQVGRAAAAAGTRMIFMSSVKVHGEEADEPLRESSPIAPRDVYADSKAQAEAALRAIAGLRLTVLRPPLVYGPGVKANFLALMKAIARGVPLPFAGISNRRSLVYVGNLASAVIACVASGPGGTFLVSDGAAISTERLCALLGRELGRPARLFRLPATLIELVPGAKPLTRSLALDDTAIRSGLHWQPPFSLDEGLRATAHWFRAKAL